MVHNPIFETNKKIQLILKVELITKKVRKAEKHA